MFFRSKKQKTVQAAPSHPAIQRARTIVNLMDSAITIPVIRKKIGLDPLLGLFPVGGDVIATGMALYIIYIAYDLGLPKEVLVRMGVNTLIDTLIGAIPVVGDISDAFLKSNQWNLKILEEAYQELLESSTRKGALVLDIQSEPIRRANGS
jgi:hypothetical protein